MFRNTMAMFNLFADNFSKNKPETAYEVDYKINTEMAGCFEFQIDWKSGIGNINSDSFIIRFDKNTGIISEIAGYPEVIFRNYIVNSKDFYIGITRIIITKLMREDSNDIEVLKAKRLIVKSYFPQITYE